ncbi:MAG: hypothetical protein VR68_10350 [Peptococcaceae bacterium BRH_c4a]|nr:MAG: hypothetical protein VR68_10350 [Peptococcaceae bacterium BRH_c4a]
MSPLASVGGLGRLCRPKDLTAKCGIYLIITEIAGGRDTDMYLTYVRNKHGTARQGDFVLA